MTEEKMKKSIIKKIINRKIQTASFEQLDINVEIQEEIEWTTPKERIEKTDKITKILLIDFIRTFNKVVDELKIDRHVGKVTSISPSISNKESDNDEKNNDFDFLGGE